MAILENDWAHVVGKEFDKPYYKELHDFLKKEYSEHTVYPEMHNIFNALHYTDYSNVKVVILGQDPYHGPNQAQGFSFSVNPEVTVPPSLRNIYKEMHEDLGLAIPNHGCLKSWAKQGVLLLNTVLTVRAKQANSHKGKGWEQFTDEVIRQVNAKEEPVVFILWGKNAQAKEALITGTQHCIIKSAHPSPFAAHKGFFGSKPFSRANEFLEKAGRGPIDWQVREEDCR